MPTYDQCIQLLKNDLELLGRPNTNLEAWMDSTLIHIEKIFGTSTQSFNFKSLRTDFRIAKIGTDLNKLQAVTNDIGYQAVHQVSELIKDLQRDKAEALIKQRNKSEKLIPEEQKNDKLKDSITNSNNLATQKSAVESRVHWFRRLGQHFTSLKIQAWGIIISASMAGMFGFYKIGYDVGTSKSDKDKIEYYQENRSLKNEILLMKDTIEDLYKQISSDSTRH